MKYSCSEYGLFFKIYVNLHQKLQIRANFTIRSNYKDTGGKKFVRSFVNATQCNSTKNIKLKMQQFLIDSGAFAINLFTAVINAVSLQANVLAQVSYFHPSLILAGKAGSCQSGTIYWTSLHRQAPSYSHKYQTRVEVTDSGKHSSLLQYDRKKFYSRGLFE